MFPFPEESKPGLLESLKFQWARQPVSLEASALLKSELLIINPLIEALERLKVDGGASLNNFLMQFQSDICNIVVSRAKIMETTALGVSYLAGLKVGVWNSLDEIKSIWAKEREYNPYLDESKKNVYINKWHKAIEMCKGWEESGD